MEDIGGYQDLIKSIRAVIEVALPNLENPQKRINYRGAILHGPSGVGKTLIVKALLNECNMHVETISASEITKDWSRGQSILATHFKNATSSAPSIIYIEDIDIMAPKKSSNVLDQLTKHMDNLQDHKVLILATTSNLSGLHNSIRDVGRLDKEFEVYVPSPSARKEIIQTLLLKAEHNLTDEEVDCIAFRTHGYVAKDLYKLLSEATVHKMENNEAGDKDMTIGIKNVLAALQVLAPSAMNEIRVEVPNVKWSDIGGQEELKKNLRETVEGPLKDPEIYKKMGIKPLKGILLYGPPGCSKTMIAKALATETHLNFINVKVILVLFVRMKI